MFKLFASMSLVALLSLSPAFAKTKAKQSVTEECISPDQVISEVKIAKVLADLTGDKLNKFRASAEKIYGPNEHLNETDRLTVFGKDDVEVVIIMGSVKGCVQGKQYLPRAIYEKIKLGNGEQI